MLQNEHTKLQVLYQGLQADNGPPRSAPASWRSPGMVSSMAASSPTRRQAPHGLLRHILVMARGAARGYIGANTALVAQTLEPAIVTLATVYVMVWGYLQLTGRIEEPLVDGLKRLVTLAVRAGCRRYTCGSTTA